MSHALRFLAATPNRPARLLAGIAAACLTAGLSAPLAHAGGGAPPGPGQQQPTEPQASFDGFGPVRLGMTEVQAVEAMGDGPRRDEDGCLIMGPGEKVPATVWISQKTKHLNGIDTPPGTKTNRGVGDGSTVDEVRAAFQGFDIEDGPVSGGDAPGLVIYDGPKEFIAHRMMGFPVHPDGTVGPPSIGRPAHWVGC